MHRFLNTVSIRKRPPQSNSQPARPVAASAADLAALYDAYAGPIYQYLFYRSLKEVVAESLTEQVFRRAFGLVQDGTLDSSTPLPWLFRLAETVHAEHGRVHARPVSRARPAAEASRSDERVVLRAAACISPEELQVVVLRFGQRLDDTEVARRLQLEPTDVARLEVQALRTVSHCVRILRDLDHTQLPAPAGDL